MHISENRENSTTKDNSTETIFVPEGLKVPVMLDFLEVLQEELKGKNVSLETHSWAYKGLLREIYSCNGQLVIELVEKGISKETSRYIPYGAVRSIHAT